MLLTSTVKFRINAMYMGGVPVAKHGTWLPGSILTVASTILGGTGEVMFEFSKYYNIYLLSEWVGDTRPETVCHDREPNVSHLAHSRAINKHFII